MLQDWLTAGVVGGLALAIYVATLAPGLLMNDSGEFQTLVVTLGHTHPTGYPVYVLSSKLVTLLPLNDLAWRVNLCSAISGALAVAGVYLLGRILTGRRWFPMIGAAALAISPTFWSQSIIAEVYTPAAALTVAILLSLAQWRRSLQTRWLFASGLLGGLSIGVHLTIALMAPAAVLYAACHKERWQRNALAGLGGVLTGCGMTLAAFAIIDWNQPPSDYFHAVIEPSRSEWKLQPQDLDSLADRVQFSLSAVQYRDNLHQPSSMDLLRQCRSYLDNLPSELPLLWLLAVVVGFVRMLRGNWRFAMLLGLTLTAHLIYVLHHDMGDIHVGYIPTYIVLTVFGVACLGTVAEGSRPSNHTRGRHRWKPRVEAAVALFLSAAILIPLFADERFMREGRRSVWTPEGEPPFEVEYSAKLKQQLTAVLNDVEDDAVVFTEWALVYPFYYVAHVEQKRTNLVFVQTYPAIGQKRLAESALEYIRRHVATRPVYLSERLPEVEEVFALVPLRRGNVVLYRVLER
jgi:hypothetical protein